MRPASLMRIRFMAKHIAATPGRAVDYTDNSIAANIRIDMELGAHD